MTAITKKSNVSLLPTSGSAYPSSEHRPQPKVPESPASNVFYAEFIRGEDLPFPFDGPSIDELIDIDEQDALKAAALRRARERIGEKYSNSLSPIARLRLSKGFSQKQLANLLGTSQSHIARMEARGSDLLISTIERLADVLDVSASDLSQELLARRAT